MHDLKITKNVQYFINTKNIISCVCQEQFKFPSERRHYFVFLRNNLF